MRYRAGKPDDWMYNGKNASWKDLKQALNRRSGYTLYMIRKRQVVAIMDITEYTRKPQFYPNVKAVVNRKLKELRIKE